MLASPVKRIPDEPGWLFEPKWDGYRCLVFREGEEIFMQSRSGKPLQRYFPEMLTAFAEALPERIVLDGELIVALNGRLDFDSLSERVHPAKSRIELLAETKPAQFVAFDLLALGAADARGEPVRQRREALSALEVTTDRVHLTPATESASTAGTWFELFEGAGLDGVMGKRLDSPYQPGKRSMVKIKHSRTADCVLAGLRWHVDGEPGELVGSLLLGLHDSRGVLHHVGVVGSFPLARRRALAEELAPLTAGGEADHPWLGPGAEDGRRIPGGINRWRSEEQPWVPLRRERVLEVSYEHTEGGAPSRFRHNAQFLRWRPDREPDSCTYEQLEEPINFDLDAVLAGRVRAR
ncbi:ATP-dependent DNA ligase [Sciscionella marina]|uniref:ATP-dependent DNA ligase n=1 Tax=Sciscionella marina TaxID=508770 RepID=UPI00037C2979|nr:ATP-dependent DNA ligase [Sciscionella marina]